MADWYDNGWLPPTTWGVRDIETVLGEYEFFDDAPLAQIEESTNNGLMIGAGIVLLGAIGLMVFAGMSEPPRRP